MVVRKCDRCGKCYEPYCEKNKCAAKNVNGIAFVHIKTDGSYSGVTADGLDLCPECLNAVIDFINNPEPETTHYFDGMAVKES